MKTLFCSIIVLAALAFSAEAVLVDGNCYLEGQTSYQGTKVKFQADSPGAVTDSTYTNVAGYYQINLAMGIYDVYFTHEGFYNGQILDQFFLTATTLPNMTLTASSVGISISGRLRGILAGDTTYFVVDDIFVLNGDSLIIEAGAALIFNDSVEFDINGYIHADGSEIDSIKLTWGGIDFNDSASDSSKLEYCFITGSSSSGIFCDFSSPAISNCAISGNTAYSGSGIYCNYSSPAISNCAISGNTVDEYGGGIYCNYSSPAISNCAISGNSANWRGGGINCYYYSSPTISNCAISGNTAGFNGGGISCDMFSRPAITGCTISGNTAVWDGGGIYCYYYSSPTISNCTISGNTAVNTGGGINCYFSSPAILNTIVEGNYGNYGVYFLNSANTTITYSDFHNNQYGNFYNPPQWVGMIITVNANGDPCDVFYNIFLNPLFYSTTGDSAYYLTANSPCIDAGDPNSPLDPDSTIADIGAFYYDQSIIPAITVTLTPQNPPIQIPAGGGRFQFIIALQNVTASPLTFDVWTNATLPDGVIYPILIRPDVTLQAGAAITRTLTQLVPAGAPAGGYSYNAYAGEHPDIIYDQDSFDFEKLAIVDGSASFSSWDVLGWEDTYSVDAIPLDFIVFTVYPNPFNATTQIFFNLPEPANVKLIIYDITGREVVRLVDDFQSAGYHSVTFDGTNLASGIYFYSITAGEYSAVKKMMLVK